MKIPEHLALSYLLAQLGPQQTFGPAGTVLMMAAGMLPDLDGVSILGGWNAHRKYHRKVGHGLPITLLGPLLLPAWRCLPSTSSGGPEIDAGFTAGSAGSLATGPGARRASVAG